MWCTQHMTVPCELKVPGLQSRKRFEKWTRTRSLSWVSPVRLNCLRNLRSATSRVSPSKLKYLRYSSATTRLKSLLEEVTMIFYAMYQNLIMPSYILYNLWRTQKCQEWYGAVSIRSILHMWHVHNYELLHPTSYSWQKEKYACIVTESTSYLIFEKLI
jgi:hypothetical protein